MMSTIFLPCSLQGRRWWPRWVIVGLLASSIVYFVLSQARLQSRWGRGYGERTIDQQTALGACKNGAASVSGGLLWIDDLRAETSGTSHSKEELLHFVHCLRIPDAWRLWIRGSRTMGDACLFATRITCLPALSFQNIVSEDRPRLALVCGGNFEQVILSLDQGKSWHDPCKLHNFLQSFTSLAS